MTIRRPSTPGTTGTSDGQALVLCRLPPLARDLWPREGGSRLMAAKRRNGKSRTEQKWAARVNSVPPSSKISPPSPSNSRSICIVPGCPTPAARRGYCEEHARTTAERGYGYSHQAARGELKVMLPGECGYGCGTILYPDSDWVAAHRVDGRPEYGWLASCRSCNEQAKGGRLVSPGELEQTATLLRREPSPPDRKRHTSPMRII